MARTRIRYDLTLGGRCDNDRHLPGLGGPNRACHHLIPAEILIGFWDACIEREPEQLSVDLIPAILRHLPQYQLVDDAPTLALRTSATHFLHNVQSGEYTHDPGPGQREAAPGQPDFGAVYTWLPGNLFVGTVNRQDDPGNGFDTYGSRVVPHEQYVVAKRADAALRQYINAGVPNGVLARVAGAALAQVVAYHAVTPYDPVHW